MKLTYLAICLTALLFINCSKDEPTIEPDTEQTNPDTETEEDEVIPEAESKVYFTLNVDATYYLDHTQSAYIVVHDANGELLGYKQYDNGEEIIFEAEVGTTVSDQLTITQFTHNVIAGGDYYNVTTYPLIEKGSVWNFDSVPSTYIPTGEFDVTMNDVPDWNFYTLSNKLGFGTSGSRYYKYFNNPEEAEPYFSIEGTNLFADNNFLLSVIDGDKNLKYTELLDVQSNDVFTLNNTNLIDFDSYLTVELPEYEHFFVGVEAFEENQDFDQQGLKINDTRDYSFSEVVNEVKLGYLSRYSKFSSTISLENPDYHYSYKIYGAKPSMLSFPESGNLAISDET